MGKYINVNSKGESLPAKNKLQALVEDGGKIIPKTELKFQKNLVCVVENYAFDAAAFAYDENEFNVFNEDMSGRKMTWLHYPYAKELAK